MREIPNVILIPVYLILIMTSYYILFPSLFKSAVIIFIIVAEIVESITTGLPNCAFVVNEIRKMPIISIVFLMVIFFISILFILISGVSVYNDR